MVTVHLSARALLIAGAAIVALLIVINLWEIVVIISTAFIFMAAMLPYVQWLQGRGLPRVVAVLVLLVAFLLIAAGLGALIVPAVIEQAQAVHDSLPEDAARADRWLAKYDIELRLAERVEELDWGNLVSGRTAVDYGQRALFIVLSLISIVVITTYLLVDAPKLATFVFRFVPPGQEPVVSALLDSLRTVVGGYVRGQIITSIVIASFTAGLMVVLGLPNALAFGLLAAIADIIPLVGATLATAPAVLIALQDSPTKAVIVLVALVAYQQFEDRYLTPHVYGGTLNLPPIIVLTAVLIGAEMFGITGVLLAMPAAAVARVLLDFSLERRNLPPLMPGTADEVLAPDEGGSA